MPGAWLLVSHPGIPATGQDGLPKSRAGLSPWPGRWACEERWQLTELLTPQFSDWKRDKERSEEEKGLGSVLYSVYSPHYPWSCFSLMGINAQYKCFLNLTLLVSLMETCFVVVQVELSQLW